MFRVASLDPHPAESPAAVPPYALAWVWIAGIAAAWCVARLAPRGHVVAWGVLMLGVAIAATWQVADWPYWFAAGIVLGVPLQAWLGAWLALRWRRTGTKRKAGQDPPCA